MNIFSNYVGILKNEFKGYSKDKFVKDIIAGVTVSAVSLPLSLAFAISSGADAAGGLVTAILAGLIIGTLSGASYQISGPTGTMTAIMLMLVANYGPQGIFIATFIAGAVLIICGIFKLGILVSFIPLPVVTGFTSGIAIIIFTGQIDNVTGMVSSGTNVVSKIASYFTPLQTISIIPFILGLAVILLMVFYPKKLRKYCPDPLAAIVVMTILNIIFKFPVPTVGEIPRTIFLENRLDFGAINFEHISTYASAGVSIAALIMIESLLCGRSASRMKNEKIDSNQELIAQGIGNMVIPFFGGVPATAALARSSVAIKAGSQTRLANIIHALVLLISMFLLGPVLAQIPLPALSGVLMVTAFRMNDWTVIKNIHKRGVKTSLIQFFITMIVTAVVDLTTAVLVGVLFSVTAFVVKVSDLQVTVEKIDKKRLSDDSKYADVFEKTIIVRIIGPIYFGTISRLEEKLPDVTEHDIVIFSMRGVTFADASGILSLLEICEKFAVSNTKIYFTNVNPNVMKMFEKFGMTNKSGKDDFYMSTDVALDMISKNYQA